MEKTINGRVWQTDLNTVKGLSKYVRPRIRYKRYIKEVYEWSN